MTLLPPASAITKRPWSTSTSTGLLSTIGLPTCASGLKRFSKRPGVGDRHDAVVRLDLEQPAVERRDRVLGDERRVTQDEHPGRGAARRPGRAAVGEVHVLAVDEDAVRADRAAAAHGRERGEALDDPLLADHRLDPRDRAGAARAREALRAVEARLRRGVVAAATRFGDVHVTVLRDRHVARVVEPLGDHVDVDPVCAGGRGDGDRGGRGERQAPASPHDSSLS